MTRNQKYFLGAICDLKFAEMMQIAEALRDRLELAEGDALNEPLTFAEALSGLATDWLAAESEKETA